MKLLLLIQFLILPTAFAASSKLEKLLFQCESKISGKACYEAALVYKKNKKASKYKEFIKQACLYKHKAACKIQNNKVRSKEKINPYYKMFLDDLKTCKKKETSSTWKDITTVTTITPKKGYCFLKTHNKLTSYECKLTKNNLKKIEETTVNWEDFLNKVREYKKLEVCKIFMDKKI